MKIQGRKSHHVLEYDKIINHLAELASSVPGQELCRKLIPSDDLAVIRQGQQQTSDALARIFQKGSVSFGSNTDMSSMIKALKIGGSLDAGELLRIAGFLDNVNRVKAYGRRERDEEASDSLTAYFDALEPMTAIVNEIRRCIISEDEISSDASPALRHVRRGMMLTNDRIHDARQIRF